MFKFNSKIIEHDQRVELPVRGRRHHLHFTGGALHMLRQWQRSVVERTADKETRRGNHQHRHRRRRQQQRQRQNDSGATERNHHIAQRLEVTITVFLSVQRKCVIITI